MPASLRFLPNNGCVGSVTLTSPSHSSVTNGVLRWVGFAAPRLAEHQQVLATVEEAALQKRSHLSGHFRRKPFQVEVAQVLLQRQPGLTQEPIDPIRPADLALPLGKLQQVLLVAERFPLGTSGQRLKTLPERRQMQLLQVARQPLLHVHRLPRLAGNHPTPPCR